MTIETVFKNTGIKLTILDHLDKLDGVYPDKQKSELSYYSHETSKGKNFFSTRFGVYNSVSLHLEKEAAGGFPAHIIIYIDLSISRYSAELGYK